MGLELDPVAGMGLEGLKIGAAADILDALEDGAVGWDEVEARRLGGVVLRPDIAARGQGCAVKRRCRARYVGVFGR